MKRDTNKVFKFASLQGTTAQQIESVHSLNIDSVVYYQEGTAFTHFKAIGAICKHLPFPYNMGMVLQFFPPFIYNWIAKNRFKWFGKKETCRMPTQEERARFLD